MLPFTNHQEAFGRALHALAARPDAVGRLQTGAIDVAARHSWDRARAVYHDVAERPGRS